MNEKHEKLISQHVTQYLPDYIVNGLPDVTRAEVEAHLRECPSCLRECDEWRMLASAVRGSYAGAMSSAPFAHAWSDLRARLPVGTPTIVSTEEGGRNNHMNHDEPADRTIDSMAGSPLDPRFPSHLQHTNRHALRRALVVAASIALVVSGFAAIFHQVVGARHPTGVGAPTPAAPALTWKDVALPVAPAGYAAAYPSVAPNDGDVAYACSIAQDTPSARPAVWRSGDRAQTWTRTTDIPFTHSDIKSCAMSIDQIDIAVAVATIVWGEPDATGRISHASNFVTFDAGASWREIGFGRDESWATLATWGGKTYSILGDDADKRHIMVSDDQMRTGTEVATPVRSSSDWIVTFWMEPAHGRLILDTRGQASLIEVKLWASDDQGRTWTPAYTYTSSLAFMTIRWPQNGGDWSFCGTPSNGDSATTYLASARLNIVCSFDGGRSWRPVSGIDESKSVSGENGGVFGIAHDGSIFAVNYSSEHDTTLYWLAPGAAQWQISQIGVAWPDVRLIPAGRHDVLWRYDFEQTANGAVYHIATAIY
jgi:hypothetical protein